MLSCLSVVYEESNFLDAAFNDFLDVLALVGVPAVLMLSSLTLDVSDLLLLYFNKEGFSWTCTLGHTSTNLVGGSGGVGGGVLQLGSGSLWVRPR